MSRGKLGREDLIFSYALKTAEPFSLHNHLCHTLSAECLASNKVLMLETSQSVTSTSKKQENCRDNQAAASNEQAQPLYQTHKTVYSGSCRYCYESILRSVGRALHTHVVGREAADEYIEFRRSWADP